MHTHFNKQTQKEFDVLIYANTPQNYQIKQDKIKEKTWSGKSILRTLLTPSTTYEHMFLSCKKAVKLTFNSIISFQFTSSSFYEWTKLAIFQHMWGHETSLYAKSLNSRLKLQRLEIAFKQSNLLWDYMMRHHSFEETKSANFVQTSFPSNIMAIIRRLRKPLRWSFMSYCPMR